MSRLYIYIHLVGSRSNIVDLRSRGALVRCFHNFYACFGDQEMILVRNLDCRSILRKH